MESLADSNQQITWIQLNAELEELKYDLCFDLDENEIGPDGSAAENPVDQPDWDVCALGLRQELPQFVNKEIPKYDFYKTKFLEIQKDEIHRNPVPTIPIRIINLIPRQHGFKRRPNTDVPRKKIKPLNSGATPEDKFFNLLIAMMKSFITVRHHEVVSFGVHLLCNLNFMEDIKTRWFYLHIWGMLAGTFARLRMNQTLVQSCISIMRKYKRTLLCDEIDSMLYEQNVYSFNHDERNERSIYLRICTQVPSASIFLKLCLETHLYAAKRCAEESLALAWCFQIVDKKLAMRDECLRGMRELYRVQRDVYTYLSKPSLTQSAADEMKIYQESLSLLIVAFNCLLHPKCSNTANKLKIIAVIMKDCEHHLDYFLSLFVGKLTLESYRRVMLDHRAIFDKQQRCMNFDSWGIISFQHFLLLSILTKTKRKKLEAKQRLIDAVEIFEKVGSKRSMHYSRMCLNVLLKVNTVVEKYKPDQSKTPINNFDVVKMLQLDSKVGELVRFGLESVQAFNIV